MKTIAVGPHHGVYPLPFPKEQRPGNICIVAEFDSYDLMEVRTEDEVKKLLQKQLLPLNPDIEIDDPWGFYTVLKYVPIKYDRLSEGQNSEHNREIFQHEMSKWAGECVKAFAQAGGDDDVFDYVPSFIDAYEQACRIWGFNPQNLRKALWLIRPDYPEFFSEEEIKSFIS